MRMNRNSQPMTEILLFHQPVRPGSQTSRWKRWLLILFSFSSVSSESVFFAYDTTISTTRKLRICAYYLVFYFCQSIPRRQAGSFLPCALWCATHSQQCPCRGHPSLVQGQSSWSAWSPRPPFLFKAKSQLASPYYAGNGSWWIFYFRSNMPRMRRR